MDTVTLPVDVIDTSEVSIVDVQIDDHEIKSEVTDIGGNVDDAVGVKVLWSVGSSDLREFQVITEEVEGTDKSLTLNDDPGKVLSLHDHDLEQAQIRTDDDISGNSMHIVVAENISESTIIGHHGNRLLAGDDSLSGDGISTREGVHGSVVLSTADGMSIEEGHMLHVPDTDPRLLSDGSSSIQVASSLASALTAQVDQDVIQLLLPNNGDHSSAGQAISISLGSTSVGSAMAVSPPVQTLQSITFSDGSTAFIQHPTKFLEGQTITLDDGTTAVVQGLPGKLNIGTTAIATPVATEGNKMSTADSQTVQLEDGTTGYLNQVVKDGLQAIVLEDGTTAYLATQQTPQFMENATLEATTFTLDQLTSQVPGVQALIPNTMVNMDAKPHLVSTQTVISNVMEQHAKNVQMTNHNGDAIYVPAPSSDKSLAFGEKAYKCNFEGCGRLYTTMHHLKVHERSHTGDRPFRCEFASCEKAFATGYGLKSHIRVHTGEKPYKCPEEACEKAFKTSGDLQKHVRTHTGERPFKCPFEGCTRSFTTSNIRKVHIRTHTGERPYVCPEDNCGRAFASATNYKNHVRIHTGEKPYICTVQGCGKRFTEYSSLYKHHVVHTHSKPYTCNRCGKTYRQTSTLAMHKRTAHGEDTTSESEAAFFEGQDGYEPPEKRTRLNFTLMPEVTPEDGEGTLIINTSEPSQQLTLVDSDNLTSVIAGATDNLGVMSTNSPSTLLRHAGVATFTLGDAGQQVYVITDPAQLEALQQIAQQHMDNDMDKDSGTAPTRDVMTLKRETGVSLNEINDSVTINSESITVNGCSVNLNTANSEPNSIHVAQYEPTT